VPRSFYELYRDPKGFVLSDDPNFGGELPAPQIELFVGSHSGISFDEVSIPAGITVRDFRRAAGSLVEGVVYDMNTGKAIENAAVELTRYDVENASVESPITRTDASGRYALENLPVGGYSVAVRAAGYAPRGEGFFVSREHAYREATTYLSPIAEVSGLVVDAGDNPLQGVKIVVRDAVGLDGRGYPFVRGSTWPNAVTDAEGRFQIGGLPQGYVRLTCADEWYSDTIFELYATSDTAIRITAARRGTVRVTLLDPTGAPFNGEANIWCHAVRGPGGYAWDGAATFVDGVWEWSRVPPDEYAFALRGDGVQPEDDPTTQIIRVEPGAVAEITVRIPAEN
jgi:hypothetical protein